MTEVTYKLSDSGLTPTTQEVTLVAIEVDFTSDRDLKIFDLGVMAFLIEDILSGYKLPNFLTDLGRQKEKIVIRGILTASLHDPVEETAWALRKFFNLTAYRYKVNKIEIGDYITQDNISVESSGAGPIYCRPKMFHFKLSGEHCTVIPYDLEVWVGKIVRIID